MGIHAVIGILAALTAFAMDFVPMDKAIVFYALFGVTAGALFAHANRWAREGLIAVVGGLIISVLIGEVLPSFIDVALENTDGPSAILLRAIPFLFRAALFWVAISTLLEKLRRYGALG